MTNPFSNPIAPGAPEPAPRPRDLEGCLVAYAPREFTKAGAPGNTEGYEGADPRDRVTADLILLQTATGTPISYGGAPEIENPSKRTQHYLQVAGPARFEGVWISNTTIVRALAPNGQALVGQLVLGRVVRSTYGRNPFNLDSVEGKPDMNVAIDIYTRLSMGALAYNTAQPIPGAPIPASRNATPSAPMPPANSVSYGYAPSPVPPAPTAWATPPVAGVPLPPAPAPDPAAQAQAMLAAAGLQPVTVAPPVPQPPQPPALEPQLTGQGWTPETWAQLTQDQKSQVRVSVGLPPF